MQQILLAAHENTETKSKSLRVSSIGYMSTCDRGLLTIHTFHCMVKSLKSYRIYANCFLDRFSKETTICSEGSQTIDWSELVGAAEAAQRELSEYWPAGGGLICYVFSHHLGFLDTLPLCLLVLTLPCYPIDHFRVALNLIMKARLGAKFLL